MSTSMIPTKPYKKAILQYIKIQYHELLTFHNISYLCVVVSLNLVRVLFPNSQIVFLTIVLIGQNYVAVVVIFISF